MRPLVEIIVADICGLRFMSAILYNEHGRQVDRIVKPVENERNIKYAVIEFIGAHSIESIDLRTDSEVVFKAFLPVLGINVAFTHKEELASLYRVFRPGTEEYEVIRELWITPETPSPLLIKKPTRWERFKTKIKGVFNND
ncbi:hypothetical protein [Paenibacillus sp. Leaf72]|uniref:hypothetical protein n=1 Tax=Paenibacillus sp. Leaf72 TaxID=1736234 RepID=UPI0006F52085|nr:hypothetical protein [Paenibacillus sp. Leaf72]KQN97588.1 hypothetical protein ASF12_20460 [Paenibacillus sp. Leaf72]